MGRKNGKRNGPAIFARDLVQNFGAFRAVDHLSFEVSQGEIFGLLGANGAGKTTAIKMLTGILPSSSGNGQVAGVDMQKAAQTIKSRVGYMSQAFSLYEDLSAHENLKLYGGIYGLSGTGLKERIRQTLALTGLQGYESEMTQGLPMGVRQRLALSCALLHRPSILFLDEPTSGVDPLGRRRFWEILFQLSREEGVTILVTTHYMNEAEHCDHLVLMYAGRSVADETPAGMKLALRKEAGELLELTVDRPVRVLEVLEKNGLSDAAIFGNCIHLLTKNIGDTVLKIRFLLESNSLSLHKVDEIPISMEDVFVHRVMALEKHASQRQQA
ncbi:ATP-binding cassette domain-containing protein [Prosthecochloris sp. SCSIO W1101]|uniref:ABC transporter ATP-binding protein n=1 Tax=Prosthecochloris sp. SCSIO W1101 TaxID=2992242 RepID=UPI00223E025F|nr:ATP-binding cassette domain-containing protein [Prosthecochloris sp. SCSIO W1101]UZJ42547.1 ATP-binding cassette domain-containing protein [Prosthecochloris sp. SCSIO W1101]